MPFICTFEVCSKAHALYDSTAAWLNHMRLDHARYGWTCLDPSHDEPLCFLTKAMFSQHIAHGHGDDLSSEELGVIAEDSYGILEDDILFDRCPFFCDEDTSHYSCDALNFHVARHLLLLSQISLAGHDPIETIDSLSSMDDASQPQALDSQKDGARNTSNRRIATSDETRLFYNHDRSDMSDNDLDTPAEHISNTVLPIPWSTELEAWTDAGDWDEICRKIDTLGGYDQGTDKVLQSFILPSPEKTPYKDTEDSYGGMAHESPIAERSKSPQQPIHWSQKYQRYYRLKFNLTTRMYCM